MKRLSVIIGLLCTLSLFAQDNKSLISEIKEAELQGDKASMIEISKNLLQEEAISYGLLSWNYNNVIGLDANALVLTQSNNDTYPIWVLQYAKNIREDIVVINLELIQDSEYRSQKFQELGIPELVSNDALTIMNHLVKSPINRSVYLSASVERELVEAHSEYLYPTGLPFKYAESSFNNLKEIERNYEEKYLLDYIKLNTSIGAQNDVVIASNLNYIPSFVLLENHYKSIGAHGKAFDLNNLIRNIAKTAGKEKELDNFYTKNNQVIVYKKELPFIELQKELVEVGPNLYAHRNELMNEWYNYFLEDLVFRKEYELVQLYGPKKTQWRSYLSQDEQALSDDKIFEHGYPDDDYLPVSNISIEAANAFCEWLTDRYAIWGHNKKEFNKVTFRLPSSEEWEFAARGNTEAENYPWDYQFESNGKKRKFEMNGPANANGCYLANFYSNTEKPCETCPALSDHPNSQDGGFFMVRVDAYWPNNAGLYNMIGNIGEFTSDGLAKGGSWHTTPLESTIGYGEEVLEPTPWNGFRIFMSINE